MGCRHDHIWLDSSASKCGMEMGRLLFFTATWTYMDLYSLYMGQEFEDIHLHWCTMVIFVQSTSGCGSPLTDYSTLLKKFKDTVKYQHSRGRAQNIQVSLWFQFFTVLFPNLF